MKKASNPNFEYQNHGAGGGIPILKTVWEKFGFSYLFSNIDKHSGLSAWKLVFAYVSGLIANSSSVNKIAEHCNTSPIIREILGFPEDMENGELVVIDFGTPDEKADHFKGSYLLISNRFDAPEQAVIAYAKRWKIEVFYRNAKQELGLTACHSQTKVAHEAHIEMIFIAETLLNYINWELNKEGAITLTHGEVIREIINASHRICFKSKLQLYYDISIMQFASFIKKFWPKYIMIWALDACRAIYWLQLHKSCKLLYNFTSI